MLVILYVMDSLRPDFLSCYGYEKETSPNIDGLAEEGVLFTNAFAQATWTRPSCASILTALYPAAHHVITLDDELSPNLPTIAEVLGNGGFKTAAFSSMVNISTGFGFGRGFRDFTELFTQNVLMKKRAKLGVKGTDRELHCKLNTDHVPLSTSEDINDFLVPFLERLGSGNTFIFIWSMDTHSPYFHRDPRLARFAKPSEELWRPIGIVGDLPADKLNQITSIYADMIYHNDHHIGILIKELKRLGLYDETLLVITGDHGESFGEHGLYSHGKEPYDEQIRVPLVIKFPLSQFKGRIEELVQHIDLAPTIADYAGLPTDNLPFQGRSLLPLLNDGSAINDFVFSEYHYKETLPRFTSLRTLDHKYVEITPGKLSTKITLKEIYDRLVWLVAKPRMLFSLRDDPRENVNVCRKERELTRHFHDKTKTVLEDCDRLARDVKPLKRKREDLDEGVVEQLKALGYFD